MRALLGCRGLGIAAVVILILVGAGSRIGANLTYDSGEQYRGEWLGTLCRDGWISSSSGQGTCSWHGGVKESLWADVRGGLWHKNERPRLSAFLLSVSEPATTFWVSVVLWLLYGHGLVRLGGWFAKRRGEPSAGPDEASAAPSRVRRLPP